MTRRDQLCRAWISRHPKNLTYHSHVSFQGKRHTLSTGTRHRRAALEFCRLHAQRVLAGKPTDPPVTEHPAPPLFP